LKVRFAGFRTVTRSVTVPGAIDTGPEIVAATAPLLRALDVSVGVRLLGVSTSNFAAPSRQLSLLDDSRDLEAVSRTAETIDGIRERFGAGAIGPASSITERVLRVVRKGAQQWGPDQSPSDSPPASGSARHG
jgi:DNA polymerase-4